MKRLLAFVPGGLSPRPRPVTGGRRDGYPSLPAQIPTEPYADRAPALACLVLLAVPVALVTLACIVAGFIALPARALVCLGLIGGALAPPTAFPVRLR